MVDERNDYRPAQSRDFERAASRVDASELRADPPPAYETSYERTTAPPARPLAPPAEDTYRPEAAPIAAPRRVEDRRVEDRPVTRVEERTVDDRPQPFSIAAGFFGWAVASFFTLVLGTLVLALLGAAAYNATDAGTAGVTGDTFNDLTTGGLVGLLVALFAAYFLGGYAAGRIGLWHGTGHGLAVVAWTVLFTVLLIGLGAALGDATANLYVTPAIDWSNLAGPAIVGLLVTLAAMIAGAVLGANLGTRPYGIDDAYGRRARAWRGRPL